MSEADDVSSFKSVRLPSAASERITASFRDSANARLKNKRSIDVSDDDIFDFAKSNKKQKVEENFLN